MTQRERTRRILILYREFLTADVHRRMAITREIVRLSQLQKEAADGGAP